jgi:hypothetical protein
MGLINQIKVTRSRKINLGNYETADVFVELSSGNLNEKDDPDQVFVDLVNKINEYLDAEVNNVISERLKKK